MIFQYKNHLVFLNSYLDIIDFHWMNHLESHAPEWLPGAMVSTVSSRGAGCHGFLHELKIGNFTNKQFLWGLLSLDQKKSTNIFSMKKKK